MAGADFERESETESLEVLPASVKIYFVADPSSQTCRRRFRKASQVIPRVTESVDHLREAQRQAG